MWGFGGQRAHKCPTIQKTHFSPLSPPQGLPHAHGDARLCVIAGQCGYRSAHDHQDTLRGSQERRAGCAPWHRLAHAPRGECTQTSPREPGHASFSHRKKLKAENEGPVHVVVRKGQVQIEAKIFS